MFGTEQVCGQPSAVVFSLAWQSHILSPSRGANWTVIGRSSACPQSLVWRGVSVVQAF